MKKIEVSFCICSSICADATALYEHQRELNEKLVAAVWDCVKKIDVCIYLSLPELPVEWGERSASYNKTKTVYALSIPRGIVSAYMWKCLWNFLVIERSCLLSDNRGVMLLKHRLGKGNVIIYKKKKKKRGNDLVMSSWSDKKMSDVWCFRSMADENAWRRFSCSK